MLRIKQLAGNLLIVEVIKEGEQKHGDLFLPSQRGAYAKARVVNMEPMRKNPIFEDLVIGDIVLIDHADIDHAKPIPRGFTFNEPKKEFKVIEEYMIRMIVEEVEEVQEDEKPQLSL